jgi:Diaminopimelate epimerase
MINEEIPEFVPEEKFSAVAVPNPHLISFVSDIQHDTLNDLGQKLNSTNDYFPEGVNISFAKILDENRLFVQTFERGVGFTNACGTGMSATSLVFALLHPEQFDSNKDITVYNPGGMVRTNVKLNPIKELSEIRLIGNATFTHNLEISEDALHQNQLDDLNVEETGEEKDYQSFIKSIKE